MGMDQSVIDGTKGPVHLSSFERNLDASREVSCASSLSQSLGTMDNDIGLY